MSFTDIQICSNALTLLGEESISAFTDESPRADTCGDVYPMFRKRLLASHPWNFTIVKVRLTKNATDPIATWSNRHGLPSDMLSAGVIAVYSSSDVNASPLKQFVIQGKYLLSEEDDIYIDYQKDIDETDWPVYFSDFAVHAFAAEIALAVTNKQAVRDSFTLEAYGSPSMGRAGGMFGYARAQDGHGAPANNKLSGFQLINARFGGVPTGPSVKY